jgi:protein tyrosine phosphatase
MKKINKQSIETQTAIGYWVKINPRQYVKSFWVMRTSDGIVVEMETLEEVKFKKWYQFWK